MSLTLQMIFRPALSLSVSYQKEHDKQKKRHFITAIFDHTSQAHEHLSSVCANISALAKITDRTTLHTVINGAV